MHDVRSGAVGPVAARPLAMRARVTALPVALAVVLAGRHGVTAQSATPGTSSAAGGEADLTALKAYVVQHVASLAEGADALLAIGQRYYDLASTAGFDYQALWAADATAIVPMLDQARTLFSADAHGNYELVEGLVAGLPNLVDFDVWLDAGPSGAEDPANARVWTLELPDGRALENPGNIFHALLEPTLWNTDPAFAGLALDTDGDGAIAIPDGLPDANVLLALCQVLVEAVAQLGAAVDAWEPTLSDAFTALVVMLPTADGYFGDWAESPFVLGEASTQTGFVANSRLLDVLGIYGGLQLTYEKVAPAVATASPDLAMQIQTEMDQLVTFVQDLYDNEQAGTRYTPEEADQFGTEVQSRAESLAGQITQAAALLDVEIQQVG